MEQMNRNELFLESLTEFTVTQSGPIKAFLQEETFNHSFNIKKNKKRNQQRNPHEYTGILIHK